ncbi:hypothetical protein [Enterobacter sp. ENT03]|uniref:hypothetical protein n=1 Tax=Enterobacter sp. ENT03 TaxID=2854780 RepID=UPI001C451B3F|nr:hypothetical protein [Enterobacter sp. ENT03]MBV7404359.1 hypothetical protein [Enterobacter sp. ENT03]
MHNSETLRYILARHNSNDGIKAVVREIRISGYSRDGINYYHGLFSDTGVSIAMTEYSYLRTYDTAEDAEIGNPQWVHWRQQEALDLKRNPFEN